MIRRIAERLGVSPNSNTANLVDYIKNSLTQDMLLCLDELHLLMYTYRRQSFFACLEVIREIYDEVRCGLVLCGTTLLMDKIAEGARGEMEQLLRRGVHRITLPNMPTKGDVTAILQHWQLEMPKRGASVTVQGITEDPLGILRKLAKHDGLLAITERLRYARKLSERAGEDLSWKHVVEAHLTIEHEAQETEEW